MDSICALRVLLRRPRLGQLLRQGTESLPEAVRLQRVRTAVCPVACFLQLSACCVLCRVICAPSLSCVRADRAACMLRAARAQEKFEKFARALVLLQFPLVIGTVACAAWYALTESQYLPSGDAVASVCVAEPDPRFVFVQALAAQQGGVPVRNAVHGSVAGRAAHCHHVPPRGHRQRLEPGRTSSLRTCSRSPCAATRCRPARGCRRPRQEGTRSARSCWCCRGDGRC